MQQSCAILPLLTERNAEQQSLSTQEDAQYQRPGSRTSSGDLEAGPSGTYNGANPFAAAMAREDLHNLKPILEDDGRLSMDVRRSSHALEAENVSACKMHILAICRYCACQPMPARGISLWLHAHV